MSAAMVTARVRAERRLEARALAALLAEQGLRPVGRGEDADVVAVAGPPGGLDGGVARLVASVAPHARCLVVGPEDDAVLLDVVAAGAGGYATWTQSGAAIADAVVRVAGGEAVIPPTMLPELLRRLVQRRRAASHAETRFRSLTEREHDVLLRLCHGQDAAAVARSLCLSVQTVRSHIQRLLHKFAVHSQLEVVSLVLDHGLVELSAPPDQPGTPPERERSPP